jgi:hypothetical protein
VLGNTLNPYVLIGGVYVVIALKGIAFAFGQDTKKTSRLEPPELRRRLESFVKLTRGRCKAVWSEHEAFQVIGGPEWVNHRVLTQLLSCGAFTRRHWLEDPDYLLEPDWLRRVEERIEKIDPRQRRQMS